MYKDKNKQLQYQKEWREKNKEKINAQRRKNRLENKEETKQYKEYKKQWYKDNKEKVLANNLKRHNEKYNSDSIYKVSKIIRASINIYLKRGNHFKKSKTSEILGCTYEEFKSYLESKFEVWMNWDNQGNPKDGIYELNKTWDIDHIIACSTATTEEELIRLNHYTNLQPLCSYTNRFLKRNNKGV